MRLFLLNILLAISWSALTGIATLLNFLAGFVIGYLALAVSHPLLGDREYFRRVPRVLRLLLFFLKELVLSSLQAVYEVLSPTLHSRPRIVRVPLEIRDDNQILVLANLISLTPGTLVLEVSPDRDALYVHTMFVDDPDVFRREIREGFERQVMEAMS
ncbi:Na+/H+ antiporter subunit E [Microbulbifer guangxiensis]|uniref:Na+/H+ antiporter subunit E n=1 Tax=Microbulbifer guangxiensis TaxID=2904249 RepID=UPI001F35C99B